MFIVYVIINIIHIWFADQPQKNIQFQVLNCSYGRNVNKDWSCDSKYLEAQGLYSLKKVLFYWYRNPHNKPKTVWQLSQVYNGNPYTNKTVSFMWIGPEFMKVAQEQYS